MTTALATADNLRQSDLADLTDVLKQQRARAFDVLTPAKSMEVSGTKIVLENMEPLVTDEGVTNVDGFYTITSIAEADLAGRLEIDLPYLRRIRARGLTIPSFNTLYEDNIQKHLEIDERKFLLRLFRSDDSHQGVLRAVVSDQYRSIDNFDVLLAVLKGLHEAGVKDPIIDADLTERRMIVRVIAPQMAVYAEKFLRDYRNPFTGEQALRGWTPQRLREAAEREGHSPQDKVVFAGFVVTNSEIGDASFRITPRIVIGPCSNGLQMTADGLARTHLGAKLEGEGLVRWSDETIKANIKLVTQQATDAVRTFLDVDYVHKQVEKLTEKAEERVTDPPAVINYVSKKLGFTEAQATEILSYFTLGGQATVGGVSQALTAAAQTTTDADKALEMERSAIRSMDLASEANKVLVKA